MHRVSTITFALLLVLSVSACSSASSEPMEAEVEIFRLGMVGMTSEGFTASGPAVDEGIICSGGDWRWMGNENPEGEQMTELEFAQAQAKQEPFDLVVTTEMICADGSGTFIMEVPL